MASTHIHCDYFRFTVPKVLNDDEIDLICKSLFGIRFAQFDKLGFSRCRYADCYTLNDHVSVYRGGTANNRHTTCFDITSTGLSDILKIGIVELCRFVLEAGGNITRFDVTADDLGNILPYDEIVKLCMGATFKERVRTKLCRNRKDEKTGEMIPTFPTISVQPRRIQFGSEKSDNYCVIYDREYVYGVLYPYLRVELRLTERKDTQALAYGLLSGIDPGVYLAGIIRGKLDFLRLDNAKKDRRSTMEWWLQFLNGAQAQRLKREPSPPGTVDIESRLVKSIRKNIAKTKRRNDSVAAQAIVDMVNGDPDLQKLAYEDIHFR